MFRERQSREKLPRRHRAKGQQTRRTIVEKAAPLFNQQGKVIGVTYAVLKGFGGSNFGIPIRLGEPLLGQ